MSSLVESIEKRSASNYVDDVVVIILVGFMVPIIDWMVLALTMVSNGNMLVLLPPESITVTISLIESEAILEL